MTTATDEVLALERRFWDEANSPDFFRQAIADGGLSVIEPMGAIPKEMAVQAAGQGERWVGVEMSDLVANEVTPDCVVVAYHARARRESDGTPYRGSIASTYLRIGDSWAMVMTCHQPWNPPGP
jgi:hypothetical protein